MYYRSNNKYNKNISINEGIGFDKDGNEITILDVLKSDKPDFALDLYEKEIFKSIMNKDIEEIYDVEGCEHCQDGYHGRIAIQEVLRIS